MDRTLRLALLAATRDDLDEVSPESLASEPLGGAFKDPAYPALVWTAGHTGGVFDRLARTGNAEESLVRDLDGLPALASELRVLDLGASRVASLAPLRALARLSLVRLGVAEGADLAPLLELPALERVAVTGPLDGPARRVLDALASRGVLVDDPAPDWAALSAPFADRTLKLALVNELRGDDLPESWPTFDEYALDEGHLARVLAVPLGVDEIEALDELTWDEGGLPIHHLVYPRWGGEDDTFALTSLAGLGPYAPSVGALDAPPSELDELAELAPFTALRALSISVTPRADLAPLRALPRLTHLTLRVLGEGPTEAQHSVLRALDRRGVVVTLG